MSNIIKNSDTLLMLTDDVRYLKRHGISKDFIEEILKQMIPTNNMQQLISYFVAESNFGDGSVAFDPSAEIIEIYLGKLYYWLENCINVLTDDFHLKDKDTLKGYQLIQIIAHEVEHVYQYLMGIGLIDAPNSTIANAYRDIYDLVTRDADSEAQNFYFANFKKLLLERNAQIESFDLILKCSEYNGRLDIYDAYKSLSDNWTAIGYKDNSDGSIHETYRLLKLCERHLKLNSEIQMNEEERIRYGFPISDEARQKILKN